MDIHEILTFDELAAGSVTLEPSKRRKGKKQQASFTTDSIP